MKNFKTNFLYILLMMIIFTSCSSKYPSVKTGAMIGGTTGAIVGGLFGAALSNSHPGNGNTLEGVLISGAILGIVGAGFGAGTGYIIDTVTDNKEIKEIRKSHKLLEDK